MKFKLSDFWEHFQEICNSSNCENIFSKVIDIDNGELLNGSEVFCETIFDTFCNTTKFRDIFTGYDEIAKQSIINNYHSASEAFVKKLLEDFAGTEFNGNGRVFPGLRNTLHPAYSLIESGKSHLWVHEDEYEDEAFEIFESFFTIFSEKVKVVNDFYFYGGCIMWEMDNMWSVALPEGKVLDFNNIAASEKAIDISGAANYEDPKYINLEEDNDLIGEIRTIYIDNGNKYSLELESTNDDLKSFRLTDSNNNYWTIGFVGDEVSSVEDSEGYTTYIDDIPDYEQIMTYINYNF